MAKKLTIAIDFDGVLHSYTSGWTGEVPIDPPVEFAREFMEFLNQHYNVIIHTTRAETEKGLEGIRAWLWKYGFPNVEISHTKPKAILYIDDRGFRFEGPESFKILMDGILADPEIAKEEAEPWNRR